VSRDDVANLIARELRLEFHRGDAMINFRSVLSAADAVIDALLTHEDGGDFKCGPHGCRLDAFAEQEIEA